MQNRLKEFEEKELHHSSENWFIERSRLEYIIDGKNQEIEKMKREMETQRNRIDSIRRENDELKRKLKDFDKVTQVKRSMTLDSAEQYDPEIRELKNKLLQEEKTHRSEMTNSKMHYDNKIALLQEEAQSTQMHLEKTRRERNILREMLDGAQYMISEWKSDPEKKDQSAQSTARFREMEENLNRLKEFHSRITRLEDELNEARTETSRVKTEYLNQKSAKDITISELQTKINELEEDRIMSMGRSRIPGTRTRLELAWQKEREEQQRLIQETSTFARDLRNTLVEVEKERDHERLEARRRLEQQKLNIEGEQAEVRKKVTELQSDLLELIDSHAELRTLCDKLLRRDKERTGRELSRSRSNRSLVSLQTKKIVIDSRKVENDTERKPVQLLVEVSR